MSPYKWNWDGVNNIGTCSCDPTFEITIATSPYCKNCSALNYAKGTVTNNTCDCNQNFVWNPTTLQC